MKKNNTIVWFITMMMTLVANPAFAASGVNYEVEVGKTLRLDISALGIECMVNGLSYTWEISGNDTNSSEYIEFTNRSKNYAIVKGLKAGKLIGIQYTGRYYDNGTSKTFYDVFYVKVVGNSSTPTTGPTTLEAYPTPQTMEVGETKWVYAKQTGAIGGTYFYSEDESIATVTRGELTSTYSYTTAAEITAKKPGKVNIIAKNVNGLTSICEVTVTAQAVSYISLSTSLTLKEGETSTLKPYIYPSDAMASLTWSSDNSSVATVSQSGVITARKAGTANIKVVTDNGKSATCKVTVKEKEYKVSWSIYREDKGKVTYNDTVLSDYGSFYVTEGSDVTFVITPNKGCKIGTFWVNYEDAHDQLVNNVLNIRNIQEDIHIIIFFEEDENKDENEKEEEPITTTENAMTLGEITAHTGTTITFPVSMTNKDNITAFQMDLYLPVGIMPDINEDGTLKVENSSRISKQHTMNCNKMGDGSYRIICYSSENATFTGNSGVLFNITLNIDAEMTNGVYDIEAKNIEFSDITGTAHSVHDAKGHVTVKSYIIGDTDNNGVHTINDVVCIINHLLNKSNVVFIESVADLDGNGKISINDAVVLISKYLLGTSSNARKATRSVEDTYGTSHMSIEDMTIQPGEVKTIEIMMYNERSDIKGIQCDITLPQGVSFVSDEDSKDYVCRTQRIPELFTLSSEILNGNTLRVAGICTGSASIYEHSGSILTVKVKADKNIKAGTYEILLSNMELAYGEAIVVADQTSTLEVIDNASEVGAALYDDGKESVVYNLKGEQVDISDAKNGIFIVNGKKIFIK